MAYSIERMPERISIGRETETGVTDVMIDCGAWVRKWPGMTLHAIHTPDGGAPYILQTETDGGVLVWHVTDADTATPGTGRMEIVGEMDGRRKVSAMVKVYVAERMDGTVGEPPNAANPWVESVIGAADRITGMKVQAETLDAGSGATAAWDGEHGLLTIGVPKGELGLKGEKGEKGPQGEKGEPGKDAVVDATLTQSGQAADAKATGEAIGQLKGDINNQREYLVNDYQSINRCDNNNMTDGMAIDNSSGKLYDNASYVSTDYIDVSGLSIIALYACLTDAFTPYIEFWRGAWYSDDKTYIAGLNNHPTANNPQRGVLTVPDGARYVRVTFPKHKNFSRYMCTSDGSLVDYVPYLYGHKDIITYPGWSGKSWLSYGDSITAIGNPTYIDGKIGEISEGSWQRKVRDYLHMGQCYGRGIGGQTFTYNARPWFANPDGSYNGRDDNGDMTDPSSYTVPDGCTAHYGYFASWDRITTMIPDSIKDSIDLITVFGVNDAMAALNFDPTTWTAPQWKLDSDLTGVRDEAWLAADESIINSNNHGDFDITDLNGAIASTILKLQARCPNAVIVFGTSWSGKGGGESAINTGNYDTDGIAYYKHGQLVKTVAHYYSIPVVDIWGTSGVNPFNRNANNQDSTHPYKSHGKMMLARAWISGLKGITAMID